MKKTLLQLSVLSVLSMVSVTGVQANAGPVMGPSAEPTPCVGCGCPGSSKLFRSGFYGGVQGGYQNTHTKFSGVYTNLFGVQFPYSASDSSGAFIGDLFLGGRYLFNNCWVAGLELGGVISTNETERRIAFSANRSFKVKNTRRYGIIPAVVVGHVFNDKFLAYFRAGLGISKFRNTAYDVQNRVSFHHTQTKTGFAPSIGVEYGVTSSMSARMEVGAEYYGKIKSRTAVLPVLGDTFSLGSKTYMYNVQLGVVVKL